MDELRYHLYHHSKASLLDLPPTSYATAAHMLRAYYVTYLQMDCLNDTHLISPNDLGYEESDGLLFPITALRLLPDDLPQSCSCLKCATIRCICRDAGVACCMYCKCQMVQDVSCNNPNALLRVPVVIPTIML